MAKNKHDSGRTQPTQPTQAGTIEAAIEADLDAQAEQSGTQIEALTRLVTDAVMAHVKALLPVFIPLNKDNPSKSYSAQGKHTIDIGRPFSHVIPVARMGGQISCIYSTDEEKARGILKIAFTQATRLSGVIVLP